jgi:histone H3/H4
MPDLVVQANVKDQLENMNVAADFYDALDDLLERAAQRAQDNDRKTVQPRDL